MEVIGKPGGGGGGGGGGGEGPSCPRFSPFFMLSYASVLILPFSSIHPLPSSTSRPHHHHQSTKRLSGDWEFKGVFIPYPREEQPNATLRPVLLISHIKQSWVKLELVSSFPEGGHRRLATAV
ncbi:hypothetical protein E2C01_046253 [Portunus trituberculatus]|uniref:Uncharacterized protein n=1 Tax=Portunus trituberculatus TaxID=210409 RepID=A0A5B7G4Q5_PORTR|nr:hypothetical protein [Portunus trituberculatus]